MAQAKPARIYHVRNLVILLLVVVLISLLISHVISITSIWNTIILKPMLNFLILMSGYFLGSFGIAIIILTIAVRLLVLPATMRQLRSNKGMRTIQPKIKELKKKYPNDRQKLGQETMKLYKETGINPFGCAFPTLIQFPIWIALYISIVQALAYTPENLLGLHNQLYSPLALQSVVPLKHDFLGLDLTRGNIVMALLEGMSMWILQKMSSIPTADSQQQSTNRIMLWGLPLLFAFLAFILPSGISLYWVTSTIIAMVIQYRVTGWGTLRMPSLSSLKRTAPQPAGNPRAKRSGTTSSTKKAGEGVAIKQVGAKTGSATSEKKETAKGDASSPGKEVDHKELGDERKD